MSWTAWQAVASAGRRLASSGDHPVCRAVATAGHPVEVLPAATVADLLDAARRDDVVWLAGDAESEQLPTELAAALVEERPRRRRGRGAARVVRRARRPAARPGHGDGRAAPQLPLGPRADPRVAGEVPPRGDLRDPRGDRDRGLHAPAGGARRPAAAGGLPRPGRERGPRRRVHDRRRRRRDRRQARAPAPARVRGPRRRRRERGRGQLGDVEARREGPGLRARGRADGAAGPGPCRQGGRQGRQGRRAARSPATPSATGCWRSSSRPGPPARIPSRSSGTPYAGSPTPSAPPKPDRRPSGHAASPPPAARASATWRLFAATSSGSALGSTSSQSASMGPRPCIMPSGRA